MGISGGVVSQWGDYLNAFDKALKSDEAKAKAVEGLKNMFLYDKTLQFDFNVTEENIRNFTFEDVGKFVGFLKRQLGITNTKKPTRRRR